MGLDAIKTENIKCLGKMILLSLDYSLNSLKHLSINDNLDHIKAGIEWLSLAQDMASDGGISQRYSLLSDANCHQSGWQPSYPETTGYIIPTFLNYAALTKQIHYKERALRMADWLLIVQKGDGSIKGGNVKSSMDSLVFDTGQVIFGLVDTYRNTHDDKYLAGAIRAGDWLIKTQNTDGTWIRYSFNAIPHTYYSRVAWALLELYRITSEGEYLKSACKNIDWVLTNQRHNGWFDQAGFTLEDHKAPLTHTIVYTMRGVLECGLILNNEKYISAARKSADAILQRVSDKGCIPGRFNSQWEKACRYSCLTGDAQLSIIFLKLYGITKDKFYFELAKTVNIFLKSKQLLHTKHKEIRGAIPGSSPIWGGYEPFSYPNWATKFFIDALMLEDSIDTNKN